MTFFITFSTDIGCYGCNTFRGISPGKKTISFVLLKIVVFCLPIFLICSLLLPAVSLFVSDSKSLMMRHFFPSFWKICCSISDGSIDGRRIRIGHLFNSINAHAFSHFIIVMIKFTEKPNRVYIGCHSCTSTSITSITCVFVLFCKNHQRLVFLGDLFYLG